jgi:hypothetical protein
MKKEQKIRIPAPVIGLSKILLIGADFKMFFFTSSIPALNLSLNSSYGVESSSCLFGKQNYEQ